MKNHTATVKRILNVNGPTCTCNIILCIYRIYIWSNQSNLTRPHRQKVALEGNFLLFQGHLGW